MFRKLAPLQTLVRIARSRWAIEVQYRDLKSELGLDHFEGRSYRGWNHHAVLAAMTFTFLQLERRRRTNPLPTFPEIRDLMREVMAALLWTARPAWLQLAISFQMCRRPTRHTITVPSRQMAIIGQTVLPH
jgi:hypothetical protein